MRILLAIAVLCLSSATFAHRAPTGWDYDVVCCNGTDCSPIDDKRVQRMPHGYLIDGEHFIEQANVRQSQDGDYHACFWPTPDKLRCFYAPPEGS